YRYTERFDGPLLTTLRVSDAEIEEAAAAVPSELQTALQEAKRRIENFHRAQLGEGEYLKEDGVALWRKIVPINRVGLYVPGGTAPLVSTTLMLGIPAQTAGCSEVVLVTPPDEDGEINPAILYAASLCGITEIYKLGGAQAIAALAYGSESIAPVDKIFGPGNQWVTEAKAQVGASVCAIDLPAGPSEVLVVATEKADPAFVASDLLSQAEHGPDSQAMLVVFADRSTGERYADRVVEALRLQLTKLPRADVAAESLSNSKIFIIPTRKGCASLVNAYAPEHLIINLGSEEEDDKLLELVYNAGSVFLGPWSPESSGDYASGTNHTLPTAGWARGYSGLSTDSFIKKITVQRLSEEGLARLAPTLLSLAEAEGLEAHRNAVAIRIEEPS
ncbi:MAG TPA: histidinol dehydrogenase, partial [Sphaerochaeta sp.]|nr:histidinol dehydrogenase [Sphaerochaeta sp.]